MKAPVELHRPTILNIIAIVSYCLATLFHIIAYATDNWASLLLDGVRWRMGLWQGCKELEDGSEYCTTDVFEDKAFQSGSDWHLGARVMMTLALIILFVLEFTLIGYACIKNLEKYKSQLVGSTIALSLSAAFSHFLVLIMYGTEVEKIPDSQIKASYGIVIICLIIEVFLPCFVYVDKNLRYPSGNTFLIPKRFINTHASNNLTARQKHEDPSPLFTIDRASVSLRTSTTSLTEAETFKRFASDEVPDPSLVSLGSINSINTRSTFITGTSQSADRSSIESGV
ncbi:uncharacterized protein LOC132724292 isoform X2 [Ruditapes philippinarum]|uniref:uncharacterized protein LOC132724292 isoform X2 n=1 Tax=Ruditapes philippinarum TaxID=129788 RepID=UPI00295B0600|nr:uncharacterized protein LOC132724292 isoform X2 [Ruditapes philippinarum]